MTPGLPRPSGGAGGHIESGAGILEEGDVRFGSKADIGLPPIDFRFTPKSGHRMSAL
jgi:hypothetical protein